MPFLAPAIAAVGSAFTAGGIFAAGGALSVVGRLLVTVAVSALGRALASQPRTPGIRNERTQTGGVNGATFVLGRYATGGTAVCPEMTYGLLNAFGAAPSTPNEYLVYVIDLGDIAGGDGLEKVIVDGVEVPLGTVADMLPAIPIYGTGAQSQTQIGTVPAVSRGLPGTGDYAGKMWVKFCDGTETTADPYLRRVFADYPERPWTEDMIGTGVPYVILTFKRDPKLFSGFPDCRFVVGGIPLYDWRKDSSVGGSGAQRWDTPSTWQPSLNPVVMVYNILRGIKLAGGFVWGGQAPASALRLAEWTLEANKCDTGVALSEGGTEPQWRAGLEVSVFDEPASIIEELLRGCMGQIADVGGVWRIRVGAPALPVWSFSDDDVIVSSPQDLTPFPSLSNTYNAVTATFPDPEMGWEPSEAPARYNAAWETLDQDRRLSADLNLSATPYANQVQRVMRAYIEAQRRFASHIITLPPEAGMLEPLDTVSWASAANGYTAKGFEVTEIAYDLQGGNAQPSLSEVDPADHNWVQAFELPFNRPSIAVSARSAALVGGAGASGIALTDGANASRRPAVRIVWTAPSAGAFRGLEWELRVAGQTAVRSGSTQAITTGEVTIAEGVLPATDYQTRLRWIADQDVEWTAWLAATSPDLRIGTADLAPAVVAAITPDTTPPAIPTPLSHSTSIVSDGRGLLVLTWPASLDTDIDGYVVRIKIGTGDFVNVPVYSPRFEAAITPKQTYSAQVLAFDKTGNRSDYCALITGTAVADTTAPAVPSGLAISPGYQLLWLKWTANTETDLSRYEILEQSASTPAPTAATAPTFVSTSDQMARTGLPDSATRHYWIRAVDTSGNKSAWSARVQGTTAASAGVNAAALAGIVDATSFASSIKPIEVVGTLPAASHVLGRQVFLTTDKKTYRNTGTGWTAEVDGADVKANSITAGQIAVGAIGANQIAANAITTDKLLVRGRGAALNTDPSFEDATQWDATATGAFETVSVTDAYRGSKVLRATGQQYRYAANPRHLFPINPEKTYLVELVARRKSGTAVSYPTLHFYNASGILLAATSDWASRSGGNHYLWGNTVPPTTWTRYSQKIGASVSGVLIPPTAAFCGLGGLWNYGGVPTDVVELGYYGIEEAVAGELIVDGTIQASHLSTGELITTSAQIKDAIITSAKILDLDAAKLRADSVLAGSIKVEGRSLSMVTSSGSLLEDMGSSSRWENYVGTPTWITSADALVGSKVLSTSGYAWSYGREPIKFDPNKLYKVTAYVRRKSAQNGGLMYLGLAGWNEAGTALVNRTGASSPSDQQYCTAIAFAQNDLPFDSWVEFTGYVKGSASTGSAAVGTIADPFKLHSNVRKISPLLICNYDGGATTIYVDQFRIEEVNTDAAAIVNAGTTQIVGGAIATDAITSRHISTGSMNADIIGAGKMNARHLSVTELLEIDAASAGFSMGKTSAYDQSNNGIYMGTTEVGGANGFGLLAGTSFGGKDQYMQVTQGTGLRLQNARHFVSATPAVADTTVTSTPGSRVVLPTGSKLLNLKLIGGGGGGGSTSSRLGGNGGATLVRLFNGSTYTGISWTSSGGIGGTSTGGVTTAGESSPFGVGGARGYSYTYSVGSEGNNQTGYVAATSATGYGAGGGGATYDYGGQGGKASVPVYVNEYDISAYANPQLEITIGVAGATNYYSGAGSPGMVKHAASGVVSIPADVVPLKPIASGTFTKGANATGSAVFPNLGPGLWLLEVDGTTGLNIGTLEIDPTNTIRLISNQNATFFASQRPNITVGNATARTITYKFYSMANWS